MMGRGAKRDRKRDKGEKTAESPQSTTGGGPRPFLRFCPAKRKELKRSPRNRLQERKKRHQREAKQKSKKGCATMNQRYLPNRPETPPLGLKFPVLTSHSINLIAKKKKSRDYMTINYNRSKNVLP